jgi:hypothetical protein
MPNWCDNSLELRHSDKTKIDAIEAELSKKNEEGRSLSQLFQLLRPNPKGEWEYDWSCTNWGTKWDADVFDWERMDDDMIRIYFNTAWSPPIALYDHLVEEGYEIEAFYHECGMCYAGMYTTEDGDDCYDYDLTDANTISEMPTDVIEFAGLEDAHENWMSERIDEYLADVERTEWFPVKTKPFHVGTYEITTKGWDFPQSCAWDGEKWSYWDQKSINKWRGLSEEFTPEKYQAMLDTIAESN